MAGLTALFSIQCVHPYFGTGPCTVLSLAPTSSCQGLMQQYGLVFRPTPGGGTMYYSDAQLAGTYASLQPLDFIVSNSDPALINYSAIDQSSLSDTPDAKLLLADSIFYADNLASASGAMMPAFADSALALRPAAFPLALAAPASSATIDLVDPLRQVRWSQLTPQAPQSTLDIALNQLPAGRYQLQLNGASQLDFYLLAQPTARRFGMLAVYPGGPLQAPLMGQGCPAIAADGHLSCPQYTFTLAPRATVWRYHLFSNTLQLGAWSVQATAAQGGSAPAFVCTNPDSGTAPWIFESQQPIALAAVPASYRIALSKPPAPGRSGRGGQKIMLPYARGASLVQPAADPLGGFSDIYVYL
ncbi:hypothetical protein [Massilia endophytica]|uniref:hypothetical protein n=1 Tax=Massilia endophytica TaxID=2899220 RepID=UPI001E38149A|nr:hypothetical protein [Massilia endophytica]UGQ48184.1 hypothetical protein LSQ66_06885 [Massilia endophytica]